jgi:hypothetical protein
VRSRYIHFLQLNEVSTAIRPVRPVLMPISYMRIIRFASQFATVVTYLCSGLSTGHAQKLSLGILAGGAFTTGVSVGSDGDGIHFVSTSKDYLIGPAVQWNFSRSFAVEANGIFRELHFGRAAVQSNGLLGSVSPAPVVTWEFPLLAKYRFDLGHVRPFVEGGPSFRTSGNRNGTNPSHYGLSGGVGLEMRAKALTFAPVLRYTRWGADEAQLGQPKSRRDQLELAIGVSASPKSHVQPFSSRVFAGVLVGVGLTDDVRTTSFLFTTGGQILNSVTSSNRGALLGPVFEFGLRSGFSLEADAIYAPLRTSTAISGGSLKPRPAVASVGNWNVPVLGKRQFGTHFASPFIDAGPAFRVGTGQLSHYGITAGLGAEVRIGRIRISPVCRYSRWAAPKPSQSASAIRGQVELLTAFAF